MSLPNTKQGLYRKFEVSRTDGSDQPGGKHDGCEYFVLDVTHDPHAKTALAAYALAVKTTHPALAADLVSRHALAAAPQAAGQQEDAKDAERYRFWRDCWGREQFLPTMQRTISGLNRPLTKGDYNNFDIVSDAAITNSNAARGES